jgi:hypothetical protein
LENKFIKIEICEKLKAEKDDDINLAKFLFIVLHL